MKKYKIIAPAGSGKTETILSIIESKFDEGYNFSDFMLVTFTRGARDEAKFRLVKKFGCDPSELTYFGTFHQICTRLLNLSGDQFVKAKHKEEFCKKHNLPYSNLHDETDEIMLDPFMEDQPEGNIIFALYESCVNRQIPLSDWKSIIDLKTNIVLPNTTFLLNEWDKFKTENGIYTYGDVLKVALQQKLSPIDTKTLIVDEFQDLTLIQYSLFKLWEEGKELVIIASDPSQTIYDWAGANPQFSLDESGDEIFLTKNYRMPSRILQETERLKSLMKVKYPMKITAIKEGGEYKKLICPSEEYFLLDLEKAEQKAVLYLFRTNFLGKQFVKRVLDPEGIMWRPLGERTTLARHAWTPNQIHIKECLYNLFFKHQPISVFSLSKMLDYMKASIFFAQRGKKQELIDFLQNKGTIEPYLLMGYLKPIFFPKNYHLFVQSLDKFSDDRKQQLIKNLTGRYHNRNFDIRVGTYHSGKGKQGDIVYVFRDYTSRPFENSINNLDSELRCQYVAKSRAKEILVDVDEFFPHTQLFAP